MKATPQPLTLPTIPKDHRDALIAVEQQAREEFELLSASLVRLREEENRIFLELTPGRLDVAGPDTAEAQVRARGLAAARGELTDDEFSPRRVRLSRELASTRRQIDSIQRALGPANTRYHIARRNLAHLHGLEHLGRYHGAAERIEQALLAIASAYVDMWQIDREMRSAGFHDHPLDPMYIAQDPDLGVGERLVQALDAKVMVVARSAMGAALDAHQLLTGTAPARIEPVPSHVQRQEAAVKARTERLAHEKREREQALT